MFFSLIFMVFQVAVNSVFFLLGEKNDHTFDGDHTFEDHIIDGAPLSKPSRPEYRELQLESC